MNYFDQDNTSLTATDGWYDRLVVGFINYSRWPMAKKWLLIAPLAFVFQLVFNLSLIAVEGNADVVHVDSYLAIAWPWLLYVVFTIPICFAFRGGGLWSERIGILMMLGYLGFVLLAMEVLAGGVGGFRLFPVGIALIGVLAFGPKIGALGSVIVFAAVLVLDVARLQGWLPVASMYSSYSLDAGNTISWYILLNLVMAEWLLMMVMLGALIFSARDRAEAALQRTQSLIRRYLPPAVADQIIAGNIAAIDVPERRRITVLFSDIVGFTDMADRLDAESLTQILNEYMSVMADVVEEYGGTLNEFAGDGLMALFGAPSKMPPEDQAVSALRAAQRMQARLPELNKQWLKLGIGESLQIRVGINTGVLSVGSFGSEGRMTYTAIGLQTNVASRIESHAEPGEVLLSDASWQLVRDQVECEPRGEVECKGVHYPVKVYAPMESA